MCIRDRYDILYQGNFKEEDVVKYRMYPKFVCEEVIVPPPKPEVKEQPI